MDMSAAWMLLVAVFVGFHETCAVYLPGLAPNEYDEGAKVDLKVNKLTSAKTQLPYRYYTLPFCPAPVGKAHIESLGETLMGDKIEQSGYDLRVSVNSSCTLLCKRALKPAGKEKFRSMIDDDYKVNWVVDGLPAAAINREGVSGVRIVTEGFPVGYVKNGHYYLNNHLSIQMLYHSNVEKYSGYRIVGFVVEPFSVAQQLAKDGNGDEKAVCPDVFTGEGVGAGFDLDSHGEVIFTYDVRWAWSEIRWASRWDAYLEAQGGPVHWFSIVNSVMIVIMLSGTVAMILLRTLHRDIMNYNELPTAEEAKEDVGWKIVHGEVFRKPNHSTMLCVSVGSGVQILGMCVVTIFFAVLGLLSPSRRGQLLQCVLLMFTAMGVFAGYTASRLCKVFDGDGARWKLTTMLTALVYPGFFFIVFFVLNLFIWAKKSSGAVPFSTLLAIVVLWFGVSLPLVLLGAHMGFRKEVIELPVKVNQIPRQVQESEWHSKTWVVSIVSGLLPFGAVVTELFFIMDSIWEHRFYYLFGFLVVVMLLLIVICAEVSIAAVYFRLTAEDHRWWWLSFFSSGASGMYLFGYSVMYYVNNLQIDKVVPTILYFGYMVLASVMFALLTGSIGLLVSFWFVRAIYGSIKVD